MASFQYVSGFFLQTYRVSFLLAILLLLSHTLDNSLGGLINFGTHILVTFVLHCFGGPRHDFSPHSLDDFLRGRIDLFADLGPTSARSGTVGALSIPRDLRHNVNPTRTTSATGLATRRIEDVLFNGVKIDLKAVLSLCRFPASCEQLFP